MTHEDETKWPADAGTLERTVRPAAWIQHHKAGDNLEWEDPGGKRTALYDEQTLWNACARVAQLERERLCAALKIEMEHSAWDGVLQLDDALRNIADALAQGPNT